MGTCYSCQVRIGKPTYPSDMSLNSDSSSKKGSLKLPSNAFIDKSSRLRPPSLSSHSNLRRSSSSSADKLNTSGESGIVLTVENTQSKYKKLHNVNQSKGETKSTGPRRARFGFQQKSKVPTSDGTEHSDANRNLMDVSSDSLDSIDSKRSSTAYTTKEKHSKNKILKSNNRAYCPKEGQRWRMIDDSESTTTDSKSISTKSRSQAESEKDRNGNAVPGQASIRTSAGKLQGITNGASGSRLANPRGISKLQPRLKPPQGVQAKRQWVKAGPMEVDENKAANVDRQKSSQPQPESNATMDNAANTGVGAGSKRQRGFFSRGRGKLQFGSNDHGGNDDDNNKQQKHVTPDSGIGDSLVEDEISKAVENMLQTGDRKDVKETINVLSKDIALVSVCDDEDKDLMTDGCDDSNDNETDDAINHDKDMDQKLSGSSTELLDREDMEAYLEAIPRPRLDSLGSCSLDSINSDDLMLETDLTDDLYNQSTCSLDKTANFVTGTTTTKTRIEPRFHVDPLSQSQPASGITQLDKRPLLRRGDSAGYWRQDSNIKGAETSTRGRRLRSQTSTSEAVNELSHMMGTGNHGSPGPPPAIQRRPPKFSRGGPASFPGPLSGDAGPPPNRAVQFRQRSKAPSISDEEQVMVEATVYRAIMQELTDCKTMVFKLKRVIQQEEIGSPFGSNTFAGTLKNGYNKWSGSGSTPDSPMIALDASTSSFGFPETAESQLAQIASTSENAELCQQLQSMQKQLDDQNRTIKLLQQQMTKYECGHYGSNGKVLCNATTQTDKPRLAVSKNILRPSTGGVHRGAGVASAGGEPVISYWSSRRLMSPKETNAEHEVGESGDKPAKLKSQLPVGVASAGRPTQRSTASRLPSMRLQRYNKAQQLQSFTKVAQPQPAN